jgi:hypothetical protein
MKLKSLLIALSIGATFLVTDSLAVKDYRLRSNINPTCTSSQGSSLKFADIHADGNIAVMGTYGCKGVFIFDISNPDAPVLSSWYNPGANLQFLEAIVIGNRGYFGTGNTGGVHIVDLTNPASPQLLGIVNAANGGGYPTIHEMMVFDQAGKRYLLENSNSTSNRPLRIIDVTDPAAAVLKWQFSASDNGWVHAMHIRGDKLYLSGFTSSTRVDIFDISNLISQTPTLLGSVAVGLSANHSTWTSEDGNFLYSAREISNSDATNPGDIRVYDVSIPTTPFLVKRISMNDLGIVAVTPHNPVVMGNKLYVSWYQAGTQVFDISQPSDPVRIGQYDTWPAQFTEEDLRAVREANKKFDPDDIVCGVNTLSGQQISGYNGNWAVYPFLGEDKVLLGDLATGLYIIDVSSPNLISDFDGDKKTDLSIFRPSTGQWTIETSGNGQASFSNFGLQGDIIVTGDYDGDGRSDIAVWRPSSGVWYMLRSSGGFGAVQFGTAGDIPVPADYDGDGQTDIAVWRPSTGVWYMMQSTAGIRIVQWGLLGDKALSGDYDGDGKADLAIWRPSTGVWYIAKGGAGDPIFAQFGLEGDRPLAADFDGDGISEIVIYRPSTGTWYVLNPVGGAFWAYNFGLEEDIPIPADYDGDGKADIAVFRPSTNVWYRLNSSNGGFFARVFGLIGDIPSPASVQPLF